jgi:hypothetical protein
MANATISLPRRAAVFALALLACALWGALWQTQFNLAELTALGLEIPAVLRLQTTWRDIYGFTPLYAAICLVGLLPAFIVAGWLARGRSSWRTWLYPLAGGVAIAAALYSANKLAGIEVLVFATRHPAGLALLIGGGVLAGALYQWRTRTG